MTRIPALMRSERTGGRPRRMINPGDYVEIVLAMFRDRCPGKGADHQARVEFRGLRLRGARDLPTKRKPRHKAGARTAMAYIRP